ncbi:acyl-CoA dehydrogenase [Schumannella soli]|uniref:Acyl-CoA dehydrogenase n=1 Tax=Schumannella soli TaxID=2590779 RepID=A0A506YAI7_9MICO|nr:acyl-CoA dehydrogenase [Schumannella soli]
MAPAPPLVSAAAVADVSTVDTALDTARRLAAEDTRAGTGRTAELWSALATLAARDLEAARAVEPHLDAVGILRDAGWDLDRIEGIGRTWGVYASEAPGATVAASRSADGSWTLDGVKPWCSLAGTVDAALITAPDNDGERRLFAVRLDPDHALADHSGWRARGLAGIPSGPLTLTDAPAEPVGEPGWYLRRDGFRWGGIGVAACWFGGAVALGRSVADAARRHPDPGAIREMQVGAVDEALESARAVLLDAARQVDAGRAVGERGALIAARARGVVARAVDEVLLRAGHALGPAPLALDDEHSRRVADLQLYVRQHHAENDQASLGRRILRGPEAR